MHKTKIKRISLSLLAIVLTGAISVGVSRALFFDEEVVETNLSLGTMNLKVGDTDPAAAVLDFTGMAPAEEREFSLNLVNSGSIDGNFWLEGVILNSMSGENSAEAGNLENCAKISIEVINLLSNVIKIVDGVYLADMEQAFETESGTTVDSGVNNGPIPMKIEVETHECGNNEMGDALEMELRFHLEQVI